MGRTRDMLRSGAWLTRERVRLVASLILLVSAVGFLFMIVTARGAVDYQGRPLGTDFSSFYAAGTYVLEGKPEAPFDRAMQHAREQEIFGQATPFYSWFYPPVFLVVAALLALLPYGIAFTVWQAATLALYLLAMRAILKIPSPEREGTAREARQGGVAREQTTPTRQPLAVDLPFSGGGLAMGDWLLLALAFPAVLVNVGHGQNGLLTAALIGGALVQLDRRPLVAGILFGLLVYKPQFGLMVPLVLAATGRWRCFAAAAATVALLAIATALVFGPHVWQAFLESGRFARVVALEQGDVGWYKMQSVFAWARMWGAPVPLAYALQSGVTAALGVALAWLWRSAASYPMKAGALCLATILATPFAFDYDMMVLAPGMAFLAVNGLARGFAPWEKTVLAALWLTPLVARTAAQATLIPFAVPIMVAAFILLLRRSADDLRLPVAFAGAASTMTGGSRGRSRGHDIAAFK